MQWLRLQVFQLAFNRLDEGFGSRGQQARMGRSDQEWPKPQPLVAKVASLPYPLDALPTTVRAAVEEVLEFTKAPVPLVASSALAALSLANQSHADVKRAEKLSGPTGLFLLTIADSGERKSTCDGFHEGHPRLRGAASRGGKPLVKDRSAALAAWEAKHNGIKDQIRQLAKKGDPTGMREAALRDLEHDKPELLRIPRLIYGDATPEALKWNLARQWPSGGVISGEGGIVFGSHGMGKDSVMRNLATLNQLWDGVDIATERRTSESFTVKGARLTIALQVQEPTLRSFFDRSGELARGTGFSLVSLWRGRTLRKAIVHSPKHLRIGHAWPHLTGALPRYWISPFLWMMTEHYRRSCFPWLRKRKPRG